MSRLTILILILVSTNTHIALADGPKTVTNEPGLDVQFRDSESYGVGAEERRLIIDVIAESEKEIRVLLPSLPVNISVIVTFVNEEFDYWGTSMGLNGHADAPGVVYVDISVKYADGISMAVNKNLPRLIYHEFHHLDRGWTVRGNKFGPGIPTAAVNEGLAVVFSELYAPGKFQKLADPDNGELWLDEILGLPLDANYGQWMSQHTDGRFSIGYRTGMYVVNKAMANSGNDIFELSQLSPDQILQLARERPIEPSAR